MSARLIVGRFSWRSLTSFLEGVLGGSPEVTTHRPQVRDRHLKFPRTPGKNSTKTGKPRVATVSG